MKLKEIIDRLDKSKKNESYIDLQELATREFDIHSWFNYSENLELKAYFFLNWYCTDSYVGGRAYFLNDELVATSFQSGRKMHEDYYWASLDAKDKVKKYILSIMDNETQNDNIQLFDLDVEYNEGFHVEFAQQLLTNDVILKETLEKVRVIEKWNKDIDKWQLVKIRTSSGEEKTVKMNEILIPYNII